MANFLHPDFLYILNLSILPVYPSVLSLAKWVKIHKSIFYYLPTSKTSIVPFRGFEIKHNNLGSTLGLPKFTKYIRDISYIPSYHLSVLVGLLLSDAGLSKQKKSKNARLGFKQSMIHFPFF